MFFQSKQNFATPLHRPGCLSNSVIRRQFAEDFEISPAKGLAKNKIPRPAAVSIGTSRVCFD